MNDLKPIHYLKIEKGLFLELILLVSSPFIFFLLAFLINSLMEAQGLSPEAIPKDTVAFFPGMATRLLYAFLVLRYCLMGLCVLMIMSGLDEITNASPAFVLARKWFLALLFLYAGAMITRVVDSVSGISENGLWIGHLYAVFECVLLIVRGRALALLIAGHGDVLDTVGKASHQCRILSRLTILCLSVLGFVRLADHFAPSLPEGISLMLFLLMAFIAVCYVILSVRIVLCVHNVRCTLEAISEVSP